MSADRASTDDTPVHGQPQPLLELIDVSRMYGSADAQVAALRNVSLRIMPGDFLSIMGPSGSGKSTMLGLLGCLDLPTSGVIRVGGHEVTDMADDPTPYEEMR